MFSSFKENAPTGFSLRFLNLRKRRTDQIVRTKSWTGPPQAGEDGEEVIYVDIRHEPISVKTSLKRIPLTCGIKYGYPNGFPAVLMI